MLRHIKLLKALLLLSGIVVICASWFNDENYEDKHKRGYLIEDYEANSRSVAYEFLKSLDVFCTNKTLRSKQNCAKFISRPNQADIDLALLPLFGLSVNDVYGERQYISSFLQEIKRDKSSQQSIEILELEYCDAEKLENGEEAYRVEALIEIKSGVKKQKTSMVFTLVNSEDDIQVNPLKILFIRKADCQEERKAAKCEEKISKSRTLFEKADYMAALELVSSLESCNKNQKKQIANIVENCRSEINKRKVRDSLGRLAMQKMRDSISLVEENKLNQNVKDEEYVKTADRLFKQGRFEAAKRNYELVEGISVEVKIKACQSCINAKSLVQRADDYNLKNKKIKAFNTFQNARELCPSLDLDRKITRVKNTICNAYISDAETLKNNGNYLDALSVIRNVFTFDSNNSKALQLERELQQYNNPSFIRSEINRVKKLLNRRGANKKDFAEAFSVLYRYRDSRYMASDGDALFFLGRMEQSPKKFGLHKTLNINKKKLRSYWKVHIRKAIQVCKNSNTCSKDVNYELSGIEDQLFLK